MRRGKQQRRIASIPCYVRSGDNQEQKLTVSLIDAYTLRAVGQEDFSDVQVPDTPAEPKKQ